MSFIATCTNNTITLLSKGIDNNTKGKIDTTLKEIDTTLREILFTSEENILGTYRRFGCWRCKRP